MINNKINFLIKLLTVNCTLLTVPALATPDCLKYKTLPSLEIKVPRASVSVVRPERFMNLLHGNVVATFAEEYEIEYGAQKADGGYCVFIEGITAVIGYTDFIVQIDRRHETDSCEFAAVKEHEDEHIRAHLSVVEDGMGDIRSAISAAANGVLPVWVADEYGIDGAMAGLEEALSGRPQIRLLRQKLAAEREIRNKRVDLNDRGERFRRCGG